ncbi:hypothetical protein GCM10009789_65990 [Kribbella sancticallisti]|uniref:Uncharacterized protein n=1 Tax=Kribbella sancticallisti TaxID=460087 RepID=A0ABP4Q7E8_9ACTN
MAREVAPGRAMGDPDAACTETVNPIGSRLLRFGAVHLKVCEPLDLSACRNKPINQPLVREATDRLMRTLQRHSAQRYVDGYAQRRAS